MLAAELPGCGPGLLGVLEEVRAAAEVDGRDARLGEAELVRAVVAAGGGVAVSLDLAALVGGDRQDVGVEGGPAEAADRHVAGLAEDVDRVDVEAGGEAGERDRGMGREEEGAEQALLLAGHRGKVDRTGRRLCRCGE